MQTIFKSIFGSLNGNSDMGILDNRRRGGVRLFIAMSLLLFGAILLVVSIVAPTLRGIARFGILVPLLFPLAFLVGSFEFVTDRPWHSIPKTLRLLALIVGVFIVWIVLAIGAINLAQLVGP
jgi:membrane-bound ClpP family serine protease